jgi:hypothetical protein
MASTIDHVVSATTSTLIDRIMVELELINQRLDHREACLTSIEAKLGLPVLFPYPTSPPVAVVKMCAHTTETSHVAEVVGKQR